MAISKRRIKERWSKLTAADCDAIQNNHALLVDRIKQCYGLTENEVLNVLEVWELPDNQEKFNEISNGET